MTERSEAEVPYVFNPAYENMLRELAVEEGQDPDRVIRDAGCIMRYFEPALMDLEAQSHQPDSPDDTEE